MIYRLIKYVLVTIIAISISQNCFSEFSCNAEGQLESVEDYSYEIRPICKPFNKYLYVKTDNPDPKSFRFVDKTSEYTEFYKNGDKYICACEKYFSDVMYEDESTLRVNGGYIFQSWDIYTSPFDGGNLTLQKLNTKGVFVDTEVEILCDKVYPVDEWLIENYINDDTDFFTNMDSLQKILNEVAIYPFSYRQVQNSTIYPYISQGMYSDVGLKYNSNTLESSSAHLLMSAAYPFILTSVSFPGKMATIAKRIEPNVEINYDTRFHYEYQYTVNGISKNYGGAGDCYKENCIIESDIKKEFFFNDSPDDGINKWSYDWIFTLVKEYADKSEEIYKNDMLSKEKIKQAVGDGGWINIRGITYGNMTFAYLRLYNSRYMTGQRGYLTESNSCVWIDGRYLNEFCVFEYGAHFEDYPTASILIPGMNFTYKEHNYWGDFLYYYSEKFDVWLNELFFSNVDEMEDISDIPDEFVLTHDEVEELDIDRNAEIFPYEGFIFDGTDVPGTPYKYKYSQEIVCKKDVLILSTDRHYFTLDNLQAQVLPEDAHNKDLEYYYDDGDIIFDSSKSIADMLAAPSAPGEYKLHIKSKDKQSEKIITIIVESAKDYPTIQFNDNTNRFVYTGEPIMPSITVRYKGKIIDSELYNIYYSDRYYNKSNIYGYNNNNFMPIDADLYNIHVQFDPELTSFTESISAEFQIREAHYIETCPRILLSDTFYICDNKIKVPQIEKVSILVGSSLEIEIPESDYIVTYSDENSKDPGEYSVTVSLKNYYCYELNSYIDNYYYGSNTLCYNICPDYYTNIPTDTPQMIPGTVVYKTPLLYPTIEQTPSSTPTNELDKSTEGDGVDTISTDGKTLTDIDGDEYLIAEKTTSDDLVKNATIADKGSNGKYKVTKIIKKKGKITGGTVTYIKPYNKNRASAVVKDTVKLCGVKFKVTIIANNAFKDSKIKKLTIGKNITKIGKNAASGCADLKDIKIKSKVLKKIGNKAFKGINAKAKFKVSAKSKLKKYTKMIKKAGAPKNSTYN